MMAAPARYYYVQICVWLPSLVFILCRRGIFHCPVLNKALWNRWIREGRAMPAQDEPLRLRLGKFRAMAAEAAQAARSATSPEMRREYENLVRAWEDLIREMEQAGN
jgi:hypothetical protein